MQEEKIKYFSNRAILISSIIGGPFSAGLLIANNLKKTDRVKEAILSVLSGIFLVLILNIVWYVFARKILDPLQIYSGNELGLYTLASTVYKLLITIPVYFILKLIQSEKIEDRLRDRKNSVSLWHTTWITVIGFFSIYLTLFMFFRFIIVIILLYLFTSRFIYACAIKVYPQKSAGRLFFSALFLFFLSLPLAVINYNNPDFNIFSLIFFYSMPILLYLLLSIVFIELILKVNRFLKLIPDKILNSDLSGKICFYLIILFVSYLMIYGYSNATNTRIQTYDVQVPKKSSKLSALKIVAASDFHLGNVSDKNFVKDVVSKINSLKPDIVFLPGDILDQGNGGAKGRDYESDFRKLDSRYGVYAVTGNHEFFGDLNKSIEFLQNSNITLLRDTLLNIEDAFYILGRDDWMNRNRKSLEEIFLQGNHDLPVLMVSHRTSELEKITDHNVALHISGHTHHGQLFPINLITEMVYELSWGYKKIGNTHFIVSCGVGTWGPPVRIGSYSEVLEINVQLNVINGK